MSEKKSGGQMTVAEAGRRGGNAVKKKYGTAFYEEIGHKGGQKVKRLIEQAKRIEAAEKRAAETPWD